MGWNVKSIPIIQTDDRLINQLQQGIKQAVGPVLRNPLVNGNIVSGQALQIGQNVVNHGLGRQLQGWIPIGQNAKASFYDNQANNPQPAQTLLIVSDAAVTASFYCF